MSVFDATEPRRPPPSISELYPAGEDPGSDHEALANKRLTESTRLQSRSREMRIGSMVDDPGGGKKLRSQAGVG